jgi:hypothetical protein
MAFFVDVPDLPGVPAVLRAAGFVSPSIALLTSDAASLLSLFFAVQQWGIYQGGFPVITADTVASLEYQKSWTISDYPVEGGAFESYDKVYVPFNGYVRFAAGETEANRVALLDSIDAIAADLNFYDIVTPEKIYSSCNIVDYNFRRTATNGLGLLVVDVKVEEVRVTGQTTAGSTQSASNASQVNGGPVQTSNPGASNIVPDLAEVG